MGETSVTCGGNDYCIQCLDIKMEEKRLFGRSKHRCRTK